MFSLIQNCSKLFYRECNTFTILFRYRTGQRVTVWRRRKCKWLKNQEKGSPLTNLDKKYNNFFPWYILTKNLFYQNKKSDCTSWLLHTKKHYPHRQRRIQQTSERSQFSTSLDGAKFLVMTCSRWAGEEGLILRLGLDNATGCHDMVSNCVNMRRNPSNYHSITNSICLYPTGFFSKNAENQRS